jgi:hypothetical protein
VLHLARLKGSHRSFIIDRLKLSKFCHPERRQAKPNVVEGPRVRVDQQPAVESFLFLRFALSRAASKAGLPRAELNESVFANDND